MRVTKDFSRSPNIVQQRFKHDVNINTIVERSRVQGLPPPSNAGFFGDFTNIDFAAMQNTVCKAVEGFNALPSKIRARFQNDPAQLIEFVQDEENRIEAQKLGLIPIPEEKEPVAPVQDQSNT